MVFNEKECAEIKWYICGQTGILYIIFNRRKPMYMNLYHWERNVIFNDRERAEINGEINDICVDRQEYYTELFNRSKLICHSYTTEIEMWFLMIRRC